jgi:hypothetical protein
MSILARAFGHVLLWLAIGISWVVSLPIVLAIAFVGGAFWLVRRATLWIIRGPHDAAREEAARLSRQRQYEDARRRATAAYVEELIGPSPNGQEMTTLRLSRTRERAQGRAPIIGYKGPGFPMDPVAS